MVKGTRTVGQVAFCRPCRLFSCFIALCLIRPWGHVVAAESALKDPGEAELRVCTQNLENFGKVIDSPRATKKRAKQKKETQRKEKQSEALAARIVNARCDVVAVQEVYGANMQEARRNLRPLLTALKTRGLTFQDFLGESLSKTIRNGFLLKEGAGTVVSVESYASAMLPKLSPLGPGRRFSRGPVSLALDVQKKGEMPSSPTSNSLSKRRVVLFTMHLKSKVDGWKDPTQTQFEVARMEMAEALRNLASDRIRREAPGAVVVVLGDRNSEPDDASARILSGARVLGDFRDNCRVDEKLAPRCERPQERVLEFRGLLEALSQEQGNIVGTYRYRGREEIIDEILVSHTAWSVFSKDGRLMTGVEGSFRQGSDHKLVWSELNW